MKSRPSPSLRVLAALTVVYFAAGKLGLSLAFVNSSTSPVWPATGIALAALLVLGYRAWPAVFLGASVAIGFALSRIGKAALEQAKPVAGAPQSERIPFGEAPGAFNPGTEI